MKVPTRFEIGDVVWFMKDNKAQNGYIYELKKYSVSYCGGGKYEHHILWNLNSIGDFKEEALFKSKDELLAQL